MHHSLENNKPYIPLDQIITFKQIQDLIGGKYNKEKLRAKLNEAVTNGLIKKYKHRYYVNDKELWDWIKKEKE